MRVAVDGGLTPFAVVGCFCLLAWMQREASPLPQLPIVAEHVARDAGELWKVDRIPKRTFVWTIRRHESPPPPVGARLSVDALLERIRVFPGSSLSLADAAKHPVRADELRFNREKGVIAEAYDTLYPGAPRLRRVSVPIYADIDRINVANGFLPGWPKNFERVAPEEGSLVSWPDAAGGPQRTWRAFTDNNPGALLSNFEYGLALNQRWVGPALVTEYHLSGPKSDWVKAWNGADIFVPLAVRGGGSAWLLTTVLDIHVDFNVGNPGDGRIFGSMAESLLSFKSLAESHR